MKKEKIIFLILIIFLFMLFYNCRDVIPQVKAPIFTPEGGTFNDYITVTIYCPTPDVNIRYTLDGNPPSPSYGIIYTEPIQIKTTTTIRAIAYRDLMKSSEVITATFTILKVAPLDITPKGATYDTTQLVTITCKTPGVTIKYTTDGTDPSPSYGNVYNGPIEIGSDTNLKAIGYKSGLTNSDIYQEIYFFTKVATPNFNIPGGTYNDYKVIEITCATPNATIKYTTDGSDPSETNGIEYSGPFEINSSVQIKAIAIKSGLDNSEIASVSYILKASDPSFNPGGGTYNDYKTVEITSATPNATIKYTTDGSDPAANGLEYSVPINISTTTTIKAVAIKTGLNNSNIISNTYFINKVLPPVFTPEPGFYNESKNITITCSTPGATIRYTTNGSDPSETYGTIYTGPINISSNTTVKAIAYKSGMTSSSIVTGIYTINLSQVASPTFNPSGGTYTTAQTVTISTNTSGATIRYTTDGTTPTSTYGNIYSGPINISTNTTLNAIAYKSGMTDSTVTSAIYNIKVATPTFSLAAGTYTGTQTVTISCSTSGATIRYTTDGTNPTSTYGNVYSGPINISMNTTLKAIAYKTNMTDSNIASSTYNIKVYAPTFSPSPGTFISQQNVTISCSTSGATIRYTLDGTDPSPTNGTIYSGAITITASTTLKAIAYKTGMTNSDITSGNYVIKVANPTFSPSPGNYTSQQTVTINCSTSGVTIRYTLDGSTPTSTSGTVYSGPITVSNSKTIKAIAYKSGLADSDVITANYTIDPFYNLHIIKDNINKNQGTEGIFVSGSYAYVAASTYGLIIVNISNPSNPSIVKTVDTPGYAYDVFVSDSYAYVADGTAGLQIINISNPSSAYIVKTVDTPGKAYDVLIYKKDSNTYAIVADGTAGVQIIDVSIPSSASIVGTVDTSGTASGVDVAYDIYHQKTFIYVADGTTGLVIIDSTNGSIVKTVNTPDFAYSVDVVSGIAYVADGTTGLVIIDVSPYQYASIVKTINTPGTALGIFVSGNYAFVSDQASGIHVVDINTIATALIIHSFNTNGSAYNSYYINGYIYVADGSEGLVILSN